MLDDMRSIAGLMPTFAINYEEAERFRAMLKKLDSLTPATAADIAEMNDRVDPLQKTAEATTKIVSFLERLNQFAAIREAKECLAAPKPEPEAPKGYRPDLRGLL